MAEHRKCVVCGTEFAIRSAQHKTCSPECAQEIRRRKRAKREGRKVNVMGMAPRPCIICGEVYQPKQSNQTTCYSHHCKLEVRRRNARARYESVKKSQRRCSICKRMFTPPTPGTMICARDECAAEHLRRQRQKDRQAYLERQREIIEAERRAREAAEMERRVAAAQCPFRGYRDDYKHTVAPMQTMVPGITSWSDPRMDPMSAGWEADGVWVEVREVKRERRKAA